MTTHGDPPVLHPRHKLQYFEDVGWEDDWITTARDIVRAEFDRKYTSAEVEEAPKPQKVKCSRFFVFIPVVHLFPKESSSSKSKNIFDNLPALSAPKKTTLRDDLDRYLSTDPKDVTDSLQWWYEHKHTYPRLHRMALDYLSIPGM
jgi:hAT family C-terminal dimerisation region